MFVKICGITTSDAVTAAVEAGADALGFVFARSPRRIEPEGAAALCAQLPSSVLRVAVMRHPTADEWRRVARVFEPDWLQTDAEDLVDLELPAGCAALPVYRASGELAAAAPRVLFEGAVSGSGRIADWDAARELAQRTQLILAGGLTEHNVAEAIRRVRPWGVDVSSGVERGRGQKDPVLIKAFVARVRAQENIR